VSEANTNKTFTLLPHGLAWERIATAKIVRRLRVMNGAAMCVAILGNGGGENGAFCGAI